MSATAWTPIVIPANEFSVFSRQPVVISRNESQVVRRRPRYRYDIFVTAVENYQKWRQQNEGFCEKAQSRACP